MSQNYTDDSYNLSHTGTTDLQNMENNFAALKSSFSGASAPSNQVAGMLWFDETDKNLKVRNFGSSAYLAVFYGNALNKIWMYSNTASDGWSIDAAVVDVVLSLKGGSQAYNATGGSQAGSWTQPNHTLVSTEVPVHTHSLGANGGHAHTVNIEVGTTGVSGGYGSIVGNSNHQSKAAATISTVGNHSHTIGNSGSGGPHNHGATYRPAAAIGTLQYLTVS
jgi:hypothetical protein